MGFRCGVCLKPWALLGVGEELIVRKLRSQNESLEDLPCHPNQEVSLSKLTLTFLHLIAKTAVLCVVYSTKEKLKQEYVGLCGNEFKA